jgi:hypothetical protein
VKNADTPDRILRGDSLAGRYDTFPAVTTLPVQAILASLSAKGITALPGVNLDEIDYEKCIHNGQVIMFPNRPFLRGSLEQLYKAGALYSYGNGSEQMSYIHWMSIPSVDRTEQGMEVVGQGSSFRIRLINQAEYDDIHAKLYPNTTRGMRSNRLIGNCIGYSETIPVSNNYMQGWLPARSLDGTETTVSWTEVGPLYVVAELLNRSDLVFPEPDEITVPVGQHPVMYYCGKVVHNGRVHWYGGYPVNTNGAIPVKDHFSTLLDGSDYKVHAPMPIGTAFSVSWSDGQRFYSFGGMTKLGSSNLHWAEKTNNIQVWEDDGTPEGVWSTIVPNVEFNMCSAGIILPSPTTGKNQIWVIGGDKNMEPELSRFSYVADIEGFDGTFTKVPVVWDLNRTLGGHCLFEWQNKVYSYGGGGYLGVSSAITYLLRMPNDTYDDINANHYATTGNEGPTTRFATTTKWRDTVLLASKPTVLPDGNYFDAWQWIGPERRFKRIRRYNTQIVKSDIHNYIWHGNKLYVLQMPFGSNGSGGDTKLTILTYSDPLEQPLKPLNDLEQLVERYYPKQLTLG